MTDPSPIRTAHLATWRFSLQVGDFVVQCPLPIDSNDADDVLELLELIKKQINRSRDFKVEDVVQPLGSFSDR